MIQAKINLIQRYTCWYNFIISKICGYFIRQSELRYSMYLDISKIYFCGIFKLHHELLLSVFEAFQFSKELRVHFLPI